MTIRWGSLIATPAGEIEWGRVVHLLSGVACVIAIVLLVLDALGHVPNSEAVTTSVWAGMLPITGGQIAGAVSGRLTSSRIQSGAAPGRRAGEGPTGTTAERPIDGGGA